ncbi:fungal-specific transcription factor domain-containing protein [Pseudomassariella vexata]|uniref:Fungal-specific transcription factor domain-domain-containing protein n=1 Tax=Pseudomassariella vexata TaxID=1141098 RepID=A0A1Y2E0Q5_9PEZI|nr:fungal-specific transcription factor domain-containing protein [Pseudomassariella vexata]ORY65123.1 fungal-specific transcription factor domain-domain-containing protein [Pseudomassariella vexata]
MSSGAKTVRSRTFTGCRSCRSRHAKCDEGFPSCTACERLGIPCEGYQPQLRWLADHGASPQAKTASSTHRGPASSYRYPLFSEDERRRMSIQVGTSLGSRSASELVLLLDVESEKAESLDHISAGPFSVFNIRPSQSWQPLASPTFSPQAPAPAPAPAPSRSPDDSTETSPSTSLVGGEGDGHLESIVREDFDAPMIEFHLGMFDDDALVTTFHQHESFPDLDLHFPDSSFYDFGMPGSFFHEAILPNTGPGLPCVGQSRLDNADDETSARDLDTPPVVSPRSALERVDGMQNVPEHAGPLLRYYKQHMMKPSSSMQAKRKSPWQILFLPCALETFAELTLWNQSSHTRSTILYSLVAHSAFQLHQKNIPEFPSTVPWGVVGLKHQQAAQRHLRIALQTEMQGGDHVKYTQLLMAILAAAMVSLFNSAHNFRSFLLDAERLIRLYGLKHRKTYKMRILHHMYTYLRVVAESTSIANADVNNKGSFGTPAVVLRRFRIAEDALNIGLDPAREKTMEVGYNDIHLEVQGYWKETLFTEIYGVPESLITLLSQVISFANEKTRLESKVRNDPAVSTALNHHIKTLESNIWSWKLPGETGPQPLQDSAHGLWDQPNARSMTLAMHQALIIYLYRRVYNVNAMILQDSVRKTLDYLQPCIDEGVDDQDFATSIVWPVFIASCEAMTPELQEQALKCLSAIDDKGTPFTTGPMRDIVFNIWSKRLASGDWTLSWPGA